MPSSVANMVPRTRQPLTSREPVTLPTKSYASRPTAPMCASSTNWGATDAGMPRGGLRAATTARQGRRQRQGPTQRQQAGAAVGHQQRPRRQLQAALHQRCSPGPAGSEEEEGSKSCACTRSGLPSSSISLAFTFPPRLEGAGAGAAVAASLGAGDGRGAARGAGAGLLAFASLRLMLAGLGEGLRGVRSSAELLERRRLGAGAGAGAASATASSAASSAARNRILVVSTRWVLRHRACGVQRDTASSLLGVGRGRAACWLAALGSSQLPDPGSGPPPTDCAPAASSVPNRPGVQWLPAVAGP